MLDGARGLVRGFWTVLRHAAQPPTTVLYPEVKRTLPPAFRGRHRLYRHADGLERCIGCVLCERWCPWDAIDMVPTLDVAQHVANKGGPPEYVEKNWERLVGAAQALVELALEQQKK